MHTAFGDERKRKINLGGVSSATSPAAILSQVQAERQARAEHKRRMEGATRIQAWYRGTLEARRARAEMKTLFATDVGGLTGLRCLVLIGRDDEVLSRWAEEMLRVGPEAVLRQAGGKNGQSWLVLMRKACVLLLYSIQAEPESDNARKYMRVLGILLSHDAYVNVLRKEQGTAICSALTAYVLQHNYYSMLGHALGLIPVSSKKSPSIPPLLHLITLPLSTFPSSSPEHIRVSSSIIASILTLPLLPNRLPLDALSQFVGHLPIKRLDDLAPTLCEIVQKLTPSEKIHLTANLYTIVSPNYKSLSAAALGTYLDLQVALINSFHEKLFKGKKAAKGKKRTRSYANDEDDDEDGQSDSDWSEGPSTSTLTRVAVVQSFDTPLPPPSTPPKIDDRTKNRLQKLVSATHLTSLISATQSKMPYPPSSSPDSIFHKLVGFLFAIAAAWPRTESASIWNTILAVSGGGAGLGLVGALYRTCVRASPLNKRRGDDEPTSVFEPKNAAYWTPLLLFCDLYAQALLTMGDDEFFGPPPSSASTTTAARGAGAGANSAATTMTRNPLVLDELIELSRILLDVAFELYWRGGGVGMAGGGGGGGVVAATATGDPSPSANVNGVPQMVALIGPQIRCTWDLAREKVTKCLVGIHARDSRKPFVPRGHWLITSQLDMNSFVEAAVIEDQQLNSSSDSSSSSSPSSSSSSHHITPRFPLSNSKRHHRQHHQHYLASLSPRLAILNNIPFAIPFETRVSIFRHFVLGDKVARASGSRGYGGMGMGMGMGMGVFGHGTRPRVSVRREMVAQDGFDRLSEVDLKGPVEITFVDQWGNEEAGIDGGGVFKEFFTSLCREVFDTDRGLWLANTKRELYPNPHAYATEPHSLNWYRFIGRILGKAMYEGILVDVAFAGFFLAKWLGRQSFLDDLFSLDPELYKGLIYLKHYKGNPEDLSLNFTVAIDEFGETKSVDLIPNGSNIAVTSENRLTYIYLVSHYRLSKQIKLQSNAFFEGLSEMIDSKWIRMFNQQEVQILIGGVNSPIDLDDLRNHTNYGGLYDNHHPTIIAFWNVVNSFDQEQRRALLRFVTSCSRPPLLGFKELNPNFSIRDAGSDQHRLPTSSTCVNLLKLPRYESERTLREKLLQAIFSGAGFDLS